MRGISLAQPHASRFEQPISQSADPPLPQPPTLPRSAEHRSPRREENAKITVIGTRRYGALIHIKSCAVETRRIGGWEQFFIRPYDYPPAEGHRPGPEVKRALMLQCDNRRF